MQFPSPAGPLLYNTGFDPAARPWSPGVVAILLAVRRAIEQHAVEYDLMRGCEEYKYRMGAVDRPMYQITLAK
jgi:CelD/BcsL family acetyltransferase involved in cellulose biosynthesis